MKKVRNKTYDEERSLYGISGALIENCSFKGANDGESPLKESKNIKVNDSYFELRYPFWRFNKIYT